LRLRIGRNIPANVLKEIEDDEVAAQYLQYKTYLLHVTRRVEAGRRTDGPPAVMKAHQPVAPAVAPERLVAEVASLPPDRLLHAHGGQEIWYFCGREAPALLAEIGRLRELSFRGIGEGTGKPSDLDAFDDYYHHMFLWDVARTQVLGAYRMGPADLILPVHGPRGLYTNTLFRMSGRLLEKLSQGVEMGRSFVRPEQQRSFTALLMLWRGIGAYVNRNPRYRYLFGPVSISNDYHPLSQQILVAMLKRHKSDADFATDVKPRNPFRQREYDLPVLDAIDDTDSRVLADLLGTLEDDEKGVPVLLRQYLKLGGRILGFNVDPAFSNAIDGMLVVDLLKSDRAILAKYFTEVGVERLHAHHAGDLDTSSAA
jgi:putative hemolysin